jgi:endonuclease G, mitochondrial
MKTPQKIARSASQRVAAASDKIQSAHQHIVDRQSLKAEPVRDRAIQRVAVVAKVDRATAAKIVDYERPASLGLTGESLRKAEVIQGKSVDYVGVAWLEAGRIASNAVARIIYRDGSPLGSGFLVSDRLLLTNNHVIPDQAFAGELLAEFRYEISLGGAEVPPVRFELDPRTFFETDDRDDLDYTLIALGQPLNPGASATDFGCCPLSDSSAKHSVGEPVTIIQHPDGDYKQVVLRENRILHRGDTVLHYTADTEGGASGSPVFNDAWQVVALHHWGAPHREVSANRQPLNSDVNEGIRISAITLELQQRMAGMNSSQRSMLDAAFNAPPLDTFGTRSFRIAGGGAQAIIATNFIETPLPMTTIDLSEKASLIDRNYDNRRGYNSNFLAGLAVPMPQLSAEQRRVAARASGVGDAGNPYELKYEHFSVVMNAQRRMPFFSICNIDGSRRNSVVRKTGKATGEEASENWALDPRIPDTAQLSDAFYRRLNKSLLGRRDYFSRGHMTRREDPNWGNNDSAERANADTFHIPNACPQVQNAFNGSTKAWLGLEEYVLNAADTSNLRVTVITGPVFDEDDPIYDDDEFGPIKLPRQFWKVIARVEDGKSIAFAILADQSRAMEDLLTGGQEAIWDWPSQLSRDYITTIAEVERLTGLDFGDLLSFDIYASEAKEHRLPIDGLEMFFPRRFSNVGEGFGRFSSIGAFLENWEAKQRASHIETEDGEDSAAEAKKRPRRNSPKARKRKVVEIEARVARVFADDLSGSKHQQFTIVPTKWVAGNEAKTEVERAKDEDTEVRVAVRFGDSQGIADRIRGIRRDVELRLKGEWITAQDAYDVGGEDLPVLHFTHDPLGFICTPDDCFS